MTGALRRSTSAGATVPRGGLGPDGPETYLGLLVAGLPNLFTLTGPGSPSVLSNMVSSIEHHVEWIAETHRPYATSTARRDRGRPRLAGKLGASTSTRSPTQLFPPANSWYLGANIPGKPQGVHAVCGGLVLSRQSATRCAEGYNGFALSGEHVAV